MEIDECYRILDLRPGASAEEAKAAWRDLTKVWHPDRFANDPVMQQKAEEKLKQINEAYETIRGGGRWSDAPPRPSSPGGQLPTRSIAYALTAIAIFVLVRRPTAGGLLIAGALMCASFLLLRVR